MENMIVKYLKTYPKKTIPLSELEDLWTGKESYEDFAFVIESLVDKEILKPVKAHGVNGKSIPLYNTYRIIKANLRKSINSQIQYFSIKFNPHIHLDIYFSLDEKEWYKDLPYIEKIHFYLKENGLPDDYATTPERSFQLVGDEKWIDEKGGKKLLERIELWDKLKITTNPDPLMLAVNPLRFKKDSHIHLVVENKAPFYALMEHIKETNFTSLIYGGGWKIASNIHRLPNQLGLEDKLHRIYYFGDIDAEGISIWYFLYEKYKIELALPFYKALFKKDYFIGKKTQQKNKKAIQKFKSYFDKELCIIEKLVQNNGYIPQEGLKQEELANVWRNSIWMFP